MTQVLKSMMTSGAAGPSRTTTTPEDELFDTLQRQLDALKLRAFMASSAMALSRRDFWEKMDPGQTRVNCRAWWTAGLRTSSARPTMQRSGMVPERLGVTLAGDVKRMMRQARTGSVLTDQEDVHAGGGGVQGHMGQQSVCGEAPHAGPLGHFPSIRVPGVELLAGKGGDGRPGEETLEKNVKAFAAKLKALNSNECKPWKHSLHDYVAAGRLVSGYRAVMDSQIFDKVPEKVRSSMMEEVDLEEGWEYLKAFPLPRRTRKRFWAAENWCVNLFSGRLPQQGFSSCSNRATSLS